MAGVGLDRRVKFRVRGGRVQAIFDAAAEVDLDRVKAPRGERVDVLLVVAIAALPRAAAAVRPGIGVQTDAKPRRVQRARQPRQAMRPLPGADRDFPVGRARPVPPADVEPHVAVAVLLEAVGDHLARLLQDRRLAVVAAECEVCVPAHVWGRRKDAL